MTPCLLTPIGPDTDTPACDFVFVDPAGARWCLDPDRPGRVTRSADLRQLRWQRSAMLRFAVTDLLQESAREEATP